MGKKIDFQKNKNKNGAESNYKHKTLKPRKAKKYIYIFLDMSSMLAYWNMWMKILDRIFKFCLFFCL